MRLLLDSCVWGPARSVLESLGHDVDWVGGWGLDPGDESILRRAQIDERALVTLDKDFGELAVLRGIPHHGIIRLVNIPAKEQALLIHRITERYESALDNAAIVTASQSNIRIRP